MITEWIKGEKVVDINKKDYESLEAALLWYGMADDKQLADNLGSLARVAIGMHGSNKSKKIIDDWRAKMANATKKRLTAKEEDIVEAPVTVIYEEVSD